MLLVLCGILSSPLLVFPKISFKDVKDILLYWKGSLISGEKKKDDLEFSSSLYLLDCLERKKLYSL